MGLDFGGMVYYCPGDGRQQGGLISMVHRPLPDRAQLPPARILALADHLKYLHFNHGHHTDSSHHPPNPPRDPEEPPAPAIGGQSQRREHPVLCPIPS